jgi:serine/threonine protein kinase
VLLGEHNGEFAAIKLLKNAILLDERERRRFDQEIINLKKLDHPAIPKVVDFDVVDAAQPWIATSFISGPTLQERVVKRTLRIDEWLKALKEITDALSYIHSLGVIHRDISPSNIILSDDGAKLIDFGLSFVEESQTLTKTGLNIQGTPVTVSPESITFRRDLKMDMFSLGSTFVYAGTGAFPFQHEDHEQENWLQSVLFEAPDFHNLDSAQIQFVTPLLYKNSRDRVSSADFLKILSSAGFHDDQVRLNSPALNELLLNSEEKLRGSTRNDLNVKANGRKRRIILIGLMGLLLSIFVISRFVYIRFVEIAILLFLGVFPILAISSGFIAFFKGIGRKKWGKRRLLASSGLTFAGILAPYLAVVIFALSSVAPYSLQSLLDDALGNASGTQVSDSPRLEIPVVPEEFKDKSPRTLEVQILIDSARASINKKDYSTALTEATQAAKLGSAQAFYIVGQLKYFEADELGAKENYLKAAKLNFPDAFFSLGQLAQERGNKKEAIDWWTQGKLRNNTASIRSLAQLYLDLNNREEFILNLRLAATLNDEIAMYEIARYHSGGATNSDEDPYWLEAIDGEEALYWAKEASDRGLNGASVLAGWLYESIEKWNLANYYYKRAADQGDPEGMLFLARLNASRGGDLIEACKTLRKALKISISSVPFAQRQSQVSDIFVEDEIRGTIKDLCSNSSLNSAPTPSLSVTAKPKPSAKVQPSNNPASSISSAQSSDLDNPKTSSDKFQISAPLTAKVVQSEIFGRPWKSQDLFWNIPLQASSSSAVPDLTGIQFRPLGNESGPWFEIPYKLKQSQVDKTVYASVDSLLFAFMSKSEFCPEFRIVKEESGFITKVWRKALPDCASDYNP